MRLSFASHVRAQVERISAPLLLPHVVTDRIAPTRQTRLRQPRRQCHTLPLLVVTAMVRNCRRSPIAFHSPAL